MTKWIILNVSNKIDLEQYVACCPSLEVAFIDAMMKKYVCSLSPEKPANRLGRVAVVLLEAMTWVI